MSADVYRVLCTVGLMSLSTLTVSFKGRNRRIQFSKKIWRFVAAMWTLAHCSNLIQSDLPRTPWKTAHVPGSIHSNRRCTTSEWKSLVERTRQSSFEYTWVCRPTWRKRFDRVWNAERKKIDWRCRLAWSFRSVRWRWALRLLVAQRTKAALSWRPSQDNFEYISMVLSLRGSRGHCDTTAQFIYTNPMYTYLPSYPPRHVVVWTTVLNFEVPLPL
jgi:hypothetical protein